MEAFEVPQNLKKKRFFFFCVALLDSLQYSMNKLVILKIERIKQIIFHSFKIFYKSLMMQWVWRVKLIFLISLFVNWGK